MTRHHKYRVFLIRLFNWEYWPVYITSLPIIAYWLFHSMRARSLFFFSTINPAIETGGFFGESKKGIYQLIPKDYLPKTLFLERGSSPDQVQALMQTHRLEFPVVVKPDIGERGFRVARINNTSQLQEYLETANSQVILQEYVHEPLEFSILCYQFPISGDYGITSVCRKEFLTVTGDGQRTIRELIMDKPRALLQLGKLEERHNLDDIPASGQKVLLEPIGNHCRGTKFTNANHLIDDTLEDVINTILTRMDGVYFGRFDLRARSVADLKSGRGFRILEFNGAGSEPAHIYDPQYPLWRAYADLWRQWSLMRRIASEQRQRGVKPMTFRQTWRALRAYFLYKKGASSALSGQA